MTEYRIDELARTAGTTVRNIRAYQDRGLLPPPRLAGRVGIYDDAHLARLRLIGQLLARGYTFAVIKDLLFAWERGRDVRDVLGLEKVLTDPWSDEIPGTIGAAELAETFGAGLTPARFEAQLERAAALGLIEPIEPAGERFRVPSPRLLHVGAELVAAGIPLPAVLDAAAAIRADCEVIAGRFVHLVDEHVFDRIRGEDRGEGPAEAAAMVRRMRPLAQMVVEPFIARAMEAKVREALGTKLELVRAHLTDAAS